MQFDKFINTVQQNNWQLFGIEVFQNGEILHRYGDINQNRYPIYSATKTFTQAAAGMAVDEGKFNIEESVYEYLKSEVPIYTSADQVENLKKITVKRLLTMSVQGYPFRPIGENMLEYSLTYPMEHVEESKFHYSNISAYLVGVAVEKAVGKHLISYLKPRLFEPLEIFQPIYGNCPSGHFYGASQMELTVDELRRFGQIYLQNGKYNGQQILSESWIKESMFPHTDCREGGYGYFMWKYNDGWRISGKWGQRCYIFPKQNMLITYLSHMEQGSDKLTLAMQEYLEQI